MNRTPSVAGPEVCPTGFDTRARFIPGIAHHEERSSIHRAEETLEAGQGGVSGENEGAGCQVFSAEGHHIATGGDHTGTLQIQTGCEHEHAGFREDRYTQNTAISQSLSDPNIDSHIFLFVLLFIHADMVGSFDHTSPLSISLASSDGLSASLRSVTEIKNLQALVGSTATDSSVSNMRPTTVFATNNTNGISSSAVPVPVTNNRLSSDDLPMPMPIPGTSSHHSHHHHQ